MCVCVWLTMYVFVWRNGGGGHTWPPRVNFVIRFVAIEYIAVCITDVVVVITVFIAVAGHPLVAVVVLLCVNVWECVSY